MTKALDVAVAVVIGGACVACRVADGEPVPARAPIVRQVAPAAPTSVPLPELVDETGETQTVPIPP